MHDPMYSDEDELRVLGLDPHRLGTPVDVAVLQADHPEYRLLSEGDLPGVQVVVDGRGAFIPITSPTFLLIGAG